MKKFISIITVLALLTGACTDRFEKVNKNPYALTDETLKQDYNFGASFTNMYRNLVPSGANYQYSTDWAADNFVTHTGTPLDEYGGRDMMSYYFIDDWNSYMWNHYYNNQMAPARINANRAKEFGEPLFLAMAELIQVMAVSNLTTYYGPVIYSEYGDETNQFNYDSEQDLYNLLFAKLDELKAIFMNATVQQATTFSRFDPQYLRPASPSSSYDYLANHTKRWAKFINSYKLRLAMRIVKADQGLAQTKFEEAVNDPAGLILASADNFWFRFTGTHPLWQMSASWGDCRMGSGFEEVLVGFEDPRIHVFFRNVDTQGNPSSAAQSVKFKNTFENDSLLGVYPGKYVKYIFPKPAFRYKGIAPGAYLDNDKIRDCYSSAGAFHNVLTDSYRKRPILLASEVNFLLAEAKLRGWTGTLLNKSVQEFYEEGIRQSFAEWGVTDAAAITAYINNDTKMPIDYDDPADYHFLRTIPATSTAPASDVIIQNSIIGSSNSYETRMKDPDAYTIKWKDGIDRELQLERIMTQKWIAGFQNSYEVWSDFRRTGYPKLTTPSMNNSNQVWGIIPNGEFIKRVPFVEKERLVNTAGVAEATRKLPSGENLISSRLWIHPDKSNF